MHPIHPMVVHFPIALLLASTLFDALAFRWRSQQFRDTSLSLLVLGILAAGVAVLTGHFAEEAVERSGIPKQAIEIHEELGARCSGYFSAYSGFGWPPFGAGCANSRGWCWPLGLSGGLLLLIASYFGGDLVYRFGAGVLPR
jgi:uncharacterized membrane protein